MQTQQVRQGMITLLAALTILAQPQPLASAPVVSRLTPPSALFAAGDPAPPIIARFLPGQRFDLQATLSPDPGQSITAAEFQVNGVPVAGALSWADATVAGKPANTVIASVRAYANSTPGVHILTVTAWQSDDQVVTAHGNFEVVSLQPTGLGAKRIILLIGDGMGIAQRTAARLMLHGATLGKANAHLSMDTFPFTAVINTHSLNSIVTDSSPGASCYATGNKANNNQHGVFPDDTTNNGDNPRIESLGEYLHRTQGRSLGIVTTTDVFDSTPGAFGSHTQARAAGSGIVDQMFDERHATGLKVLMGGGRKWFLPQPVPGSGRSTGTDYVVPTDVAAAWGVPSGALDPGRNLLQEFIDDGFAYAPDKAGLDAIPAGTGKLLGLFQLSNMNVAMDKIAERRNPGAVNVVDDYGFPDQPMLDEMTDKALEILNRNTNGFLAMIEGARLTSSSTSWIRSAGFWTPSSLTGPLNGAGSLPGRILTPW